MEEAIESRKGTGEALRGREWQVRTGSVDGRTQLRTKKPSPAAILTVQGRFWPEPPRIQSEPHSRKPVQDSDDRERNQKICGLARRFFYTVARPRTLWLPLLNLVAIVAFASGQTRHAVPTVESISARMAQARAENDSRVRPYVVTRDYKLFGKESDKTKSQVIADVTFVPPDLKKYAIQQASGTGLGERLVRRMLASEAEIAKDYASTDISPVNYDFRFIREEEVSGQLCYVLELLPRRNDKNLLRGNVWVDTNTYLLRRTEGEPAKKPSWWLRDVRIALRYNDVGGMWLQTGLEATATVRIFGPYKMVSRDLKYKISELVAVKSTPTAVQRGSGVTASKMQIGRRDLSQAARALKCVRFDTRFLEPAPHCQGCLVLIPLLESF